MSDQGVSPLLPQPTKRFSVDSGVVSLLPHMEALLQDEADGLMASAECASPPYPPACPAQHTKALLQDEADGLYRVCEPPPPPCPAQHMEALLQDEADSLYRVCEPPPSCPAQHMEALLQDECLGGGRSSHTSAQARASVGPGVSSLCALLP